MTSGERGGSRFDREAAQWDSNPGRVAVAKSVAEALIRHLRLSPRLHVMDYGAGTGLVTLRLQPLVRSIVAADSSTNMLAELERKARDLGFENVTTRHVAPDEASAPAPEFDLIVSSMTLHHIADVAALFRRFHEALKPGGRIGLADLDSEDGSFHADATGVHHRGFDRRELGALLTAAGFTDLRAFDAARFPKPDAQGVVRTYSVFLLTARRV